MKTKYKLNYQVHIAGLIAVLFIIMIKVLDCYIFHVPCFDIVFLSCLIFTIFLMINNLVKCYSLDTEGVQCKSLMKSTKIKWRDITHIEKRNMLRIKLFDFSILVYSQNELIAVIPWVKDYKDLLRQMVIHYQQEENAWIDSEVLDLIQ